MAFSHPNRAEDPPPLPMEVAKQGGKITYEELWRSGPYRVADVVKAARLQFARRHLLEPRVAAANGHRRKQAAADLLINSFSVGELQRLSPEWIAAALKAEKAQQVYDYPPWQRNGRRCTSVLPSGSDILCPFQRLRTFAAHSSVSKTASPEAPSCYTCMHRKLNKSGNSFSTQTCRGRRLPSNGERTW